MQRDPVLFGEEADRKAVSVRSRRGRNGARPRPPAPPRSFYASRL